MVASESQAGSTEPRHFEELKPPEVMALAIHIEQANARRFRTFADVFEGYDEEVARRFEELAKEEDEHEWKLVDEFHRHFGESIPSIDENDVDVVIESADLDDAEHQIFDSLAPLRVYELALKAEELARGFYIRAAKACQDPRLVDLYKSLGEMEDDHVGWLEEKIKAAKEAGEKG